jgi:hypothetical protein
MLEIDPLERLKRIVAGYRQGVYTACELESFAFDLMPIENPSNYLECLPDEVRQSLRKWVSEASSWTDEEWGSLISIRGPQPTPESRQLSRSKCMALQAYFAKSEPQA